MKDALRIKQCEVNCVAVFRYYALPEPFTIATMVDRTLFAGTNGFYEKLFAIVPGEFEVWDFVRNHGTSAVRGWRERVPTWSMQIVQHEADVLEVDFDWCNPNYGVALAVGHLSEVVRYYVLQRKTNSFSVLKGLRKRGIAVPDVREMEDFT